MNVLTAAAPDFLASLASAIVLAMAQRAVIALRRRGLLGGPEQSVPDEKKAEGDQ